MCLRLEFSKTTKLARNRISKSRLALNILGLFLVLVLGVVAAVFARYSGEWFPQLEGDDNAYKAISAGDKNSRVVVLTDDEIKTCNNSVIGLKGRYVYKCGTSRVSQCISMDFRCDGYTDCGDGSDENNCANFCGKATKRNIRFQCKVLDQNNATIEDQCMHVNYRCDGAIDCNAEPKARNDESECTNTFVVSSSGIICSKENAFVCMNQLQCVPMSNLCDGAAHCWDGSDEDYRLDANGELTACSYSS